MALYLTHASALSLYNSGLIADWGQYPRVQLPLEYVPRACNSELERVARFGLGGPLHVSVHDKIHARNSMRIDCHPIKAISHADEFIQIDESIYAMTPYAALFYALSDLAILPAVLLMSQLCSRFVITPFEERGFTDRPLVFSLNEARAFAKTLQGVRGGRGYLNVVSRSVENARSPAEVKLALRMTLPEGMGGFCLERPAINADVDLSATFTSYLGGREVDFLWSRQKVVVEYDSNEDHGERNRERDTRRAIEIMDAGYCVLSATAGQVKDIQQMQRLMANLATKIYPNRSKANLRLLRQSILLPDRETLDRRVCLNRQLNELFRQDLVQIAAESREQKRLVSRTSANARRRERYRERKHGASAE